MPLNGVLYVGDGILIYPDRIEAEAPLTPTRFAYLLDLCKLESLGAATVQEGKYFYPVKEVVSDAKM